MESQDERKPLKELKNVQPEVNQTAELAPRKAGVNRKSLIAKHSSIPKPPRSNRHPSFRSNRRDPAQEMPPPSRVLAKPRKATNSTYKGTMRSNLHSDPSRRSAAAMNFTHCDSSTRTGLSARRASQLEDLSSNAPASAPPNFDVSSLPQVLGKFMKEAMRFGECRREEVEDVVKRHIHTISNETVSAHAAEAIKLRTDILLLQEQLRDAEGKYEKERDRANSMESKVKELGRDIAFLEATHENTSNISTNDFGALQQQLTDSLSRTKEYEEKINALENEIILKRDALLEMERKTEEMASELKQSLLRTERIETNLSCRESEIRRLKRDKEEMKSEHEELLDTIKKRNSSLQDVRRIAENLQSELEQNKKDAETAVREAEARLAVLRQDLEAKVASLENDRDDLQKSKKLSESEIGFRREELAALKQTVSLQESKIAKLDSEKCGSDLKIEALQGKNDTFVKEISELSEIIRVQKEDIILLEQQAREDASTRRTLHNTIQELKGNIRVFARVRPPSLSELHETDSDSVASCKMFEYSEKGQGLTANVPIVEERCGVSQVKSRYPFKFDRVFDPSCTQESVFEEISQLVQSALDGYRVCVFAYGQTGSGKTHTMLGNHNDGGANLGMIPRSVQQIFNTAKAMEKDGWTFKLKASFLEIYNEIIRDLLTNSSPTAKTRGKDAKGKDEPYKVHFSTETNLSTVHDLTIEDVRNETQLHHLIDVSMKRRTTAATKANERSSRSHSVFRLYIEGNNGLTGETRTGLLNLIDLAGSERLSHSKAEGDRLKETKNINRSLSALGDVIAALANRDKHVPFRNSKLTYLLQDSLGGDSKTLMFVNISHARESFHESLTSLRFAAKVNSCHVGTAKRSTRIEL